MLWDEWSDVPEDVKDQLNNALSVSNLVRKYLIIL